MNFKNLFIALSGLLFIMSSCATIPEDAPPELHEAKAALDRANEADTGVVFPKTLDRAETQLDDAVALWNDSRGSDISSDDAQEKKDLSVRRANTSIVLSTMAMGLDQKVKTWDAKIEDFQKQVQAIIDESREEERTAQVEVEADEGDENFYFKGTVAFFGSDGDDVGLYAYPMEDGKIREMVILVGEENDAPYAQI